MIDYLSITANPTVFRQLIALAQTIALELFEDPTESQWMAVFIAMLDQ